MVQQGLVLADELTSAKLAEAVLGLVGRGHFELQPVGIYVAEYSDDGLVLHPPQEPAGSGNVAQDQVANIRDDFEQLALMLGAHGYDVVALVYQGGNYCPDEVREAGDLPVEQVPGEPLWGLTICVTRKAK